MFLCVLSIANYFFSLAPQRLRSTSGHCVSSRYYHLDINSFPRHWIFHTMEECCAAYFPGSDTCNKSHEDKISAGTNISSRSVDM